MAVIVGAEDVFPVLNVVAFAVFQHIVAEGSAPVGAAFAVLEHIVPRFYVVLFQVYPHQLIQGRRNWDTFVSAHFDLIDLNPGVIALYVVGVPFQGTHLADP